MNIEQEINSYVVSELMTGNPEAALDNNEPLIDSGIVDSLGIFMLIAFLEKRFDIKIQAEDVVLENFKSVNTIKQLVVARLPQGAPSPA